jgi:FKBP-type peptidyl-prolyl cis-trans isomerase (trigger factor)
MPHKHFDNLKTKKLPDSEVEVTGEITLSFLVECRTEALKELNNRSTVDGFRPGKIPEDVLIKKVGEVGVLEESAEIAIGREYPNILKELNIPAIGRPTVGITKLASGIPLEFKITIPVEPEFTLPDYKSISKKINNEVEEIKVEGGEVAEVVTEVTKQNIKVELKDGETLEQKIKENLLKEKEFKAKEKRRLSIVDALVMGTEINIPKILIESELQKMLGQFKDDVSRAGLKWEDYLKNIKKTESEIVSEWGPKAIERAKAELIVAKIAVEEKIEPSEEELNHETAHLLEHYKDADLIEPEALRAEWPLRARIYVYTMMRNEKVFEFLENIK